MPNREQTILNFLAAISSASVSEILLALQETTSLATLKRDLQKLTRDGWITVSGRGRATRYSISDAYRLLGPLDLDLYFGKDIDDRSINEDFNWPVLRDVLPVITLFSPEESAILQDLQNTYRQRASELSTPEYMKELERLAIDLSWKSSQIEGNTYSLLETERLLREKLTADGKSREEATMLLNHKDAIDFILENKDFMSPLTIASIEGVHSLLIKDLDVDRNIRTRRVGITGTNYRPLVGEFQIKEALEQTCELVQRRESVFERALLALALISYIHPFMDGNKRTARIVSNALLLADGYCPMSFRTVDSVDYKKAMLAFYEQNNLSALKQIFIEQYEFAVKTYF